MAQRTLTDADLELIRAVIAEHMTSDHVCKMELTREDAALLKGMAKWHKKAVNLAGTIVITALLGLALAIFSRGFWETLGHGIKGALK
jgi:hypothetical protein